MSMNYTVFDVFYGNNFSDAGRPGVRSSKVAFSMLPSSHVPPQAH